MIDYNYWIGAGVMGFAITIMGFVFPYPDQISFMFAIILPSCIFMLGLILITLIEKKEEGKYGKSRR